MSKMRGYYEKGYWYFGDAKEGMGMGKELAYGLVFMT